MRLIDADVLFDSMNSLDYESTVKAYETIAKAPTIDAVPRADYEELERHFVNWEPVVRCKDCVYYQDNNNGYPHNECRWRSDETPDATDFCSFGERKDDED